MPGKMFRSNQPYPFQIKSDIKKHKIKSIINLRGKRHCSSFYLEQDFCHKNNLKLYNFPISSRDLPDKKKLIDFNTLLQKIEYPCVMHCKSGADRAGLAAALYLIYKQDYSLLNARKQLTFKHLHIKYAKTGIEPNSDDEDNELGSLLVKNKKIKMPKINKKTKKKSKSTKIPEFEKTNYLFESSDED